MKLLGEEQHAAARPVGCRALRPVICGYVCHTVCSIEAFEFLKSISYFILLLFLAPFAMLNPAKCISAVSRPVEVCVSGCVCAKTGGGGGGACTITIQS